MTKTSRCLADEQTWTETEVAQEAFADQRLGRRFRKLIEQLSQNIGQSIPVSCQDWANTKAAYRFFSNSRVGEEDILGGHFQGTRKRFREAEGKVLILHDTSEFSFEREDRERSKDLVRRLEPYTVCGILMHSSLAVTVQGLPLGMTAAKFWTREKFKGVNALKKKHQRMRMPPDQKESVRWLENMRQSSELLGDPGRCVQVGDRESDIFEFFSEAKRIGTHFLIRIHVDRLLTDGKAWVFQVMDEGMVRGHHWIEIRDKEGRSTPVMTAIKYQRLEIAPTTRQSRTRDPLMLTVIHVQEVGASKGRKKIDWKLITDLSVNSPQSAIEKIKWYGQRWKIELFHKILKSGCKVEDSKMQTAQRRSNLLATCCILAWRIFWVTMLKRIEPEAPPTRALSEVEISLLDQLKKDIPSEVTKKKTLSDYLLKIAKLGGYLARANDPPPGIIVMWRGLSRLMDIETGYILGAKRCG